MVTQNRRQSPRASHCRTVFREQPSSVTIRFDPHPNAFSRSVADTSSGAFITSPRRSSKARGSVASSVFKPSFFA